MDEKLKKLVIDQAKELLEKLSIKTDPQVDETEDGITVRIDTEENALLIGKHGNTLSSLEHILSLSIAKKLGEYKRILLEIGDYRKEREEYLKNLALRLQEEVRESNQEKTIRGLKAWERRFIHMLLSEEKDVKTESRGEGRDRVLILMKK